MTDKEKEIAAWISYLTFKSGDSQSSSSSGGGTSGGGGSGNGGGSTADSDGEPGGYYVWYTGGGTTGGTTSGGDTQQSDSPADDTHHPASWSINIITEKPDGSFTQKYIDVTPGKRTESFVVYNAGDPNLFADIGSSSNNNTVSPNFGPAVILTPNQVLATYNSTKDILCDEAKEVKKLTVNKNKNIITNISNKGTYSYSTENGVITKAELTVRKGKVLTLPAGIYYLTKLTLQDGAKLNISGGTISLAGDATLYKNSELVAAMRCLPTADNRKIEVRGNATLTGTILAPDWDVVVLEGAKLSGGIICGKFSVSNSNDVSGSQRWKINAK